MLKKPQALGGSRRALRTNQSTCPLAATCFPGHSIVHSDGPEIMLLKPRGEALQPLQRSAVRSGVFPKIFPVSLGTELSGTPCGLLKWHSETFVISAHTHTPPRPSFPRASCGPRDLGKFPLGSALGTGHTSPPETSWTPTSWGTWLSPPPHQPFPPLGAQDPSGIVQPPRGTGQRQVPMNCPSSPCTGPDTCSGTEDALQIAFKGKDVTNREGRR